MKKIFPFFVTVFIFFSCKSKTNIPDVSRIKITLHTERFEQDFFSMDTLQVANSIRILQHKYPDFLPLFVQNILGLDLDSLLIPGNEQDHDVRTFIHDYLPLKDSSDKVYKNFSKQTDAIRQGLQYVKYYFPNYILPQSVITFIGPINANFETSFGVQGDVITTKSLGVGLQLHLGKNFSFYNSPEGQEQYPAYLAQNFDAEHIPVNCLRNIVDDLFHDRSKGRALIEQMVIRGRRMYLLTKFLPHTPEYICLGYSKEQMEDCNKHEAVIWDFFLNNNLLNKADETIVQNYIGESPKTPELGEGAPGNIGTYAGLQIVKKFMNDFPQTSLDELMKLPPREIYERSKYKPRL